MQPWQIPPLTQRTPEMKYVGGLRDTGEPDEMNVGLLGTARGAIVWGELEFGVRGAGIPSL